MQDIIIRKLLQSDSIPWDLLLIADPSRDHIESYIHSGELFLATINTIVVGVYVLVGNSDVVELMNIAVREDYQKKGVGKALLFDAITRAKKAKVKRIEVRTGNTSINQLAFYKKQGFKIVGTDKDYFIRNYKEKIMENGKQCRDMIRLAYDLR